MPSNTTKEKFKIAVIEDDEVMSGAVSEELEDAGFMVIKAFDGKEGLRLVLKEKPDVILLDIMMPKMDGLAMMRKVRRSSPWGKNVLCVILTNLAVDSKTLKKVLGEELSSPLMVKSEIRLQDVVKQVKKVLKNR